MSEILSPAQVDEMVNSGTPLPDMFGHLLVSHRALHDAHDAALERESAYRYMLHHVQDGLKELNAASHEDLVVAVGNFLRSTKTWEDALAAARHTPTDRECDICGKVAPHRPNEGLCSACADELVRCNERLEAE